MKKIVFLFIGIIFGITMTKSEAVSWYRIQEMFHFQSFHMYGIIGVAVVVGAIMQYWMKNSSFKTVEGIAPNFAEKPKTYWASIFGGTCFGLGWAMTGACPGPLYVLLGNGVYIVAVIIISALVGTLVYGMLRKYLPH